MAGGTPVCAEVHGVSSFPTRATCCPLPTCTTAYRTKTGTATLRGFSEFGSPSSPPKKYLRFDIDGTYCGKTTAGNTCLPADVNDANRHIVSGTYAINPSTDAISGDWTDIAYGGINACTGGTLLYTDHHVCPGGGCSITDRALPFIDPPKSYASNWGQSYAYGSQVAIVTFNVIPCGTAGNVIISTGSVQETLNTEDTEDAAIARANAAIGSWSTCTSSCSGFKVLRGAGVFSMSYKSLQFTVTANPTRPGVVYEAEIMLQKRLQGTADPYVDWVVVTLQFVGPAIGSTYVSDWQPVPVESGYEVQVGSCTVVYGS